MSALPIEAQPRWTCGSVPCEEAGCAVCGQTVCDVAEHWVNPDAADRCFRDDYWHGRIVHRACHEGCAERACHEEDEDVLDAFRDR